MRTLIPFACGFRSPGSLGLLHATTLDMAKYTVDFFNAKGDVTNKKLQKLLYYIQAWRLAYFNGPLFRGQPDARVH
jgi:uncharacterized phage-associated protein